MPAIWEKTESNFSILIWSSTEDISDLLAAARLQNDEKEKWDSFQSDVRKREWLTVRNALHNLSGGQASQAIAYNSDGKPYFPDGKTQISISHSREYVAVMLCKSGIPGIDIELIQPRIKKLSMKFMNEEEQAFLSDQKEIDKMHVIWGAKEVLYKIHSIGHLDFRNDILVQPFQYPGDTCLQAKIRKKNFEEDFQIHFEKVGPTMLTWGHKG